MAYADDLMAQARAWAGADEADLNLLADRLAGGQAWLRSKLVLRAGLEIRSPGSLTLADDWNLAAISLTDGQVGSAGLSAVNVTLRAAGDLNLTASLSDGLASRGSTLSAASAIRADGFVLQADAARLSLVGGADLSAAKATAVRTDGVGDVRIGQEGRTVIVRSSTGDIDVAAARDLTLLNRQALVYTTGLPLDASALPDYQRPSSTLLLNGASGRQDPLLTGGGRIGLSAGRDLVGATEGASAYGTDWWWRHSSSGGNGAVSWWSRYDLFNQGVATFGGGDVVASAGRDAVGLALSAAGSGSVWTDSTGQTQTVRVGGGRVALQAGRDVQDGFILSQGATVDVRAGRSLVATDGANGLQLLLGDALVQLQARSDLALGHVGELGLAAPLARQGTLATNGVLLSGLAQGASLSVASTAGDVQWLGLLPEALAGSRSPASSAADVVPAQLQVTAPLGSISVAQPLIQAPVASADLALLAGQNLSVGPISVTGSLASLQVPAATTSAALVAQLNPFAAGQGAWEQGEGQREPVRLLAQDGDLTLDALVAASPARLVAGRDLSARAVSLMHQDMSEISLLQAGRDLTLDAVVSDTSFSLKLQGPGDLLVLAGRDIVLGSSGGVGTVGNLENARLPVGGASITLAAGLKLGAQGDGAAAQAVYAHLLGGAGLADAAGALLVQLQAWSAGQAAPSLAEADRSAAAAAFTAASLDDRLAQVIGLLGADLVRASAAALAAERGFTLADGVDGSGDWGALTGAAQVLRAQLPGRVLAQAWLARAGQLGDSAAQRNQVAALAQSRAEGLAEGDPRIGYAHRLTEFVRARTGVQPADLALALAAFERLPVDQQWLWHAQWGFDELRAAGRAATAAADAASRDLAYERGYAALAALFPGVRAEGDVRMMASQIKTQQGGSVRVLTPGGGVNLGETFTGTQAKPASAIGIVTVAGGDVQLAVQDSVVVNQSRVFTVGEGDVLIWASRGDIDAGRGAKTVTGAPPPLFKIDANGNVVVDTSGSFAGSGIAVLDAGSTLDLFAPAGEINAGDAGIQSRGDANLGAQSFAGTDALQVGGRQTGGQVAAPVNAAAAAAPVATPATSAMAAPESKDDEDERRKRRRRLILDFLGFSQGD